MKTDTCPECLGAMTTLHPRWDEFCARLAGPEACDFKRDGTWKCSGSEDKPLASAILVDMGFSAVELAASLEYFENEGGCCDCEILYNIDASRSGWAADDVVPIN